MPKKSIRLEVEADLDEAIQVQASRNGVSKGEVVRACVEKFLSKVSYTVSKKAKPKRKGGTA